MAYTIEDFNKDFPTEDVCLDFLFKLRFPKLRGYYRIKGRKAFVNSKGHQIYPLAGTIFHGSRTPLRTWLYAFYLFSQAKNGVAATELQRHIGVTYKCAWRMGHQIRSLMVQGTDKLSGIVEIDETYIGGQKRLGCWKKKKSPILGMVERGGRVRAKVMEGKDEYSIIPLIERGVSKRATIMTDEAKVYGILRGYKHKTINHSMREYVYGNVFTNSIESFWSHLKGGLRGTYKVVSKQHLQKYVDERTFHWNNRENVFTKLLEAI